MRYSKLRQYYAYELVTDPKTGKSKRVARYIGKTYQLDEAAHRSARPWLILEAIAAVAAFLIGGLANNPGAYCAWVILFYAVSSLPIFYFCIAAARAFRLKPRIDEIQLEEVLGSARRSALGIGACGALWFAADLIYIILGRAGVLLTRELIFLLCGAVCAAAGILALLQLRRITVKEV